VSTSDVSPIETDPWRLDPPRQRLQIEHDPETIQQILEFKPTPLTSLPQQSFITKLASWAHPAEETEEDYPAEENWSTADRKNFTAKRKEVSLQVGPSALPNAYPNTPNVFTRYIKAANYAPSNYGSHRRTQNSLYIPPTLKTEPIPEPEFLAETEPPSRTTTESPDSTIRGYELPRDIPMAHQTGPQQSQDEEMYQAIIGNATTEPQTREAKELCINLPKPFDGNRSKLQRFTQDCAVYLMINQKVYDDDDKKIAFVLSLLESGEPAMWKEQFIRSCMDGDSIDFPMYEEFMAAFKKAFKDVDQVNEALNKLGRLRQGNKGAKEHTTTFRLLVGKAGISSEKNPNHRVLIDLYQKSLKPKLVERIMSMERIPETIEEWCEKAILFDNNWRRLMTAMGRNPRYGQNNGQEQNYQNSSRNRDPNAMDIDAMSPERQKLMKEGKCFNCEKPGHRSKDCDQPRKRKFPQNNNRSSNNQSSSSKPQFKTAREAHTYIRSIVDSLPDDEAAKVMDIAEEEGF